MEGDVTEEVDEDGIRFVTLESRFENKETVLNWLTINLSYLLCKKMVKTLFAVAKYLSRGFIKPPVSRCYVANLTHMLQTSSSNQTHVLVASNNISLSCLAERIYRDYFMESAYVRDFHTSW